MRALGRQILLECYGCCASRLNDVPFIRDAMLAAADASAARIVQESFHHFSPHGVSGVVIIAESHITIHTWPEFGYAAVDIFTCGELLNPAVIRDVIECRVGAAMISCTELRRGLLPDMKVRPEHMQASEPARRDLTSLTLSTEVAEP